MIRYFADNLYLFECCLLFFYGDRSEDSVRRAARAVKTYPSAYKDVTLHTTAMRTRSTVFPTTQNYKNMADVWDGKYGWFAPLLEYKVTIKGTPLTVTIYHPCNVDRITDNGLT
jgi:hypothetical protein